MSLLNNADCQRIEEAVRRIERTSAAEFVVAVVPRSASYAEWRGLAAAFWSVAAAIAYFGLVPWGGEVWALVLEIPVGLGAWALFGVPRLHRLLIPAKDAERAVQATAFRIFSERGVHHTRDRTGMLLLISELEHRVVILGDRGIDERVGEGGWSRHVDHVVQRIREGRAADGVLEVLALLEETLGAQVPVAPSDVNELPNRVIREE